MPLLHPRRYCAMLSVVVVQKSLIWEGLLLASLLWNLVLHLLVLWNQSLEGSSRSYTAQGLWSAWCFNNRKLPPTSGRKPREAEIAYNIWEVSWIILSNNSKEGFLWLVLIFLLEALGFWGKHCHQRCKHLIETIYLYVHTELHVLWVYTYTYCIILYRYYVCI